MVILMDVYEFLSYCKVIAEEKIGKDFAVKDVHVTPLTYECFIESQESAMKFIYDINANSLKGMLFPTIIDFVVRSKDDEE